MTLGDRLRAARSDAGYESAAQAARALGVPIPTYTSHENGIRGVPREDVARYAVFFRVSVEWLLTGKHSVRTNSVPIVAYIGAGAEVFPINDYPKGGAVEFVDPPPFTDRSLVAARVRGDSMYPIQDGWIVFWAEGAASVPQDCINKLCAVQITDGPCLVKILRPGSTPNLFTLESWNAPLRSNVVLDWAARIVDIRPT